MKCIFFPQFIHFLPSGLRGSPRLRRRGSTKEIGHPSKTTRWTWSSKNDYHSRSSPTSRRGGTFEQTPVQWTYCIKTDYDYFLLIRRNKMRTRMRTNQKRTQKTTPLTKLLKNQKPQNQPKMPSKHDHRFVHSAATMIFSMPWNVARKATRPTRNWLNVSQHTTTTPLLPRTMLLRGNPLLHCHQLHLYQLKVICHEMSSLDAWTLMLMFYLLFSWP